MPEIRFESASVQIAFLWEHVSTSLSPMRVSLRAHASGHAIDHALQIDIDHQELKRLSEYLAAHVEPTLDPSQQLDVFYFSYGAEEFSCFPDTEDTCQVALSYSIFENPRLRSRPVAAFSAAAFVPKSGVVAARAIIDAALR